MICFATLGPVGTNHELVTKQYIKFNQLEGAEIALVDNFELAIEGLRSGLYDFVVQCAVHPATPTTMGAYFNEVFAIDTFISRSKDLAVLTRSEIDNPKSIGLLAPATESYIDINKWETKISERSLPIIFNNLLEGKYDSALVYLEYAEQFPDRVRVDQVIGSPDDVWIVYGKERTSGGRLQAWHESPGARFVRSKAALRAVSAERGAT
ncbi:hypothetical protein ACVDG8_034050 [Mesorhizobium sp. ORM8.1]